MTNDESYQIYKAMKECFDDDITVFENCRYVDSNEDDIYIELKLNTTFLDKVRHSIKKDETYINECLTTIVINDLSDMITVDNVPKEINEAI